MTKTPESQRQAQRWEHCKGRYLSVLGCHRCAAQAAWGAQCGYGVVHQPCESCRPLVDALPVPTVNGWRKLGDEPAPAASVSANYVPVLLDLGELRRPPTGEWEAA
jgi:hypothetical protein